MIYLFFIIYNAIKETYLYIRAFNVLKIAIKLKIILQNENLKNLKLNLKEKDILIN